MRFIAGFIGVLLLVLSGTLPGHAEKRVALVIGNGAYRNVPSLPNPPHDAEDVAAALKRVGFDVIQGIDLDKAKMEEATIAFARIARTADVAVFYYSGHAMQFAGVNYLAPIDARLADEADLRRMTRVDEILADLQQAKNLRILVLDSCRDNPLADELKRAVGSTRSASIGRGLAKMESPDGTIISYATQSGRTAADGFGRNSPYTSAFLKHIGDKEDIATIFHRVSANVYQSSNGTQVPELSLSFFGEFYINGKVTVTVPAPVQSDPCAAAAEHWRSAETIGTVAAFEDHLARFPNCPFAGLARARVELLKSKMAVVVPPVAPATPPAVTKPIVVAPPVAPAAGSCGTEPKTVSIATRKAAPLSATEECGLKARDTFRECDKCPDMAVIPAGSFVMGAPDGEEAREAAEGPQHTVTFAKPFAVGRLHITVEQFAAFVADTGYHAAARCWVPGENRWVENRSWRTPGFFQDNTHPVVCVSWDDAKAYVAWLSRQTGKPYRLMSESEREYVTRAGTTTPFWWGATISTAQANYNAERTFGGGAKGNYLARTMPATALAPNAWGLFQVHGNVWDWVEDCFHDNYVGAPADGSAWDAPDCRNHVARGGSWWNYPALLRSSHRFGSAFDMRTNDGGFRIARTLNTP
jgi:formylglycine-generating enzyme required for sulfatase activity